MAQAWPRLRCQHSNFTLKRHIEHHQKNGYCIPIANEDLSAEDQLCCTMPSRLPRMLKRCRQPQLAYEETTDFQHIRLSHYGSSRPLADRLEP